MSTTIRLTAELKARIAERVGTEERCGDFIDTAERRYADIMASGETIPWDEMKRYLAARVAGDDVPRPKPRKLTR